MRNKKGNMNALVATGYGLIMFGVVIGLGLLILFGFWQAAQSCPSTYPTFNTTSNMCYNTNGSAVVVTGNNSATSSINSLIGYVGNGSGGLVTWVPIVIIIVIAGIVFAMFGNKGKSY